MTIREKIENHPVLWILSTLLIGFTAGIGVYQSILEIAHLEVVPEYRTEETDESAVTQSDLYATQPHVTVLSPGDTERVALQCSNRQKDKALGIDLVSEHPVKVDVLKDSIWFVTLENEEHQQNRVVVQLWCKIN